MNILKACLFYVGIRFLLFIVSNGFSSFLPFLLINCLIFTPLLLVVVAIYSLLISKMKMKKILAVIITILLANAAAYLTMEDFSVIFKLGRYKYALQGQNLWNIILHTRFEGFNYFGFMLSVLFFIYLEKREVTSV